MSFDEIFRRGALNRANWPEWRDKIQAYEPESHPGEPRTYPGYPQVTLDQTTIRPWVALDRVLQLRRSKNTLNESLPSRRILSRLLYHSHHSGSQGRGPVPSTGGLQCLELYLVNFSKGWLGTGFYHYDRAKNHLSQVSAHADRVYWRSVVPSLSLITGGCLIWVLIGDGARMDAKYGSRGHQFLLLEAGHLMQNLCLLSQSLGLCTVPLGGFFDDEIARQYQLPATDVVLYLGVLGK